MQNDGFRVTFNEYDTIFNEQKLLRTRIDCLHKNSHKFEEDEEGKRIRLVIVESAIYVI